MSAKRRVAKVRTVTASERNEIAAIFAALACEAGNAIMRAREAGAAAQQKVDGSPVTQADLDADRCIRDGLKRALPSMPVVTEEVVESHDACESRCFILVDPLDGTREFVAGRDDFTVNIALIKDGAPIAGAIYAPALSRLYVAGDAAWRTEIAPGMTVPRLSTMQPIAARPVSKDGWRAVTSRSHLDPQTQQWLDRHAVGDVCAAGSSLKFCAVAEGTADVYPRLSPTMEWDIAAGHAILAAAGGSVVGLDGAPLIYGKSQMGLRNAPFIAWGRR